MTRGAFAVGCLWIEGYAVSFYTQDIVNGQARQQGKHKPSCGLHKLISSEHFKDIWYPQTMLFVNGHTTYCIYLLDF